jgi:hypothetical protein
MGNYDGRFDGVNAERKRKAANKKGHEMRLTTFKAAVSASDTLEELKSVLIDKAELFIRVIK